MSFPHPQSAIHLTHNTRGEPTPPESAQQELEDSQASVGAPIPPPTLLIIDSAFACILNLKGKVTGYQLLRPL